MSRRKKTSDDAAKEVADRTTFEVAEVSHYGDVAAALDKTTEQMAEAAHDAALGKFESIREVDEVHDRIFGQTCEPIALQGLVDDPSARIAEAVYAQVFAAVWIKRQDLSTERRLAAAQVEAGTAMHLAQTAYRAEVDAATAANKQRVGYLPG